MTFNLKKEIKISKANKRTSLELKKYFLTLTSIKLINHYGENYSDRCLQASLGIKYLLACSGIRSYLVTGSVCIPNASMSPREIGWQGFWGQDHHYWLLNEFGELIDLAIHQVNLHPRSLRTNRHDPHPIWWNNCRYLPSFIKYLPLKAYKIRQTFHLEEPLENEKMVTFLESIKRENIQFPKNYTAPKFEKVLSNMDNLIEWDNQDDPWTNSMRLFNDNPLPLPSWIIQRERELLS